MAEQTLSGQLAQLARRVDALEEEQVNIESISRIIKAYQNIRIAIRVRAARSHTYLVCSEQLMCSEELII